MRPLLAAALAVLAVLAAPREAEACQCRDLDEAAAIEGSDHVFDGWIIAAPHPWGCALPPAPKPRRGCVRIAVVRAGDCTPRGDRLGLRDVNDDSGHAYTSIEDDATTFCNVKAGRYQVAGEQWAGDDDGTIDHGRLIDIVPGGSYVVFWSAHRDQKLRVGVARSFKGEVPREVDVVARSECGTRMYAVGTAQRFFARRGSDGSIDVSGCWGSRDLTDVERADLVKSASPPTAPAAPTAQPAPAKQRTGGCSALPLPLLLGLAACRRRRRFVT